MAEMGLHCDGFLSGRMEHMGYIYKPKNPREAEPLFAGWGETMIDSCLQGIMGEIYVVGDGSAAPRSAKAVLGDFCFLAGEPNEDLAVHKPEGCGKNFWIMVPRDSFDDSSREPLGLQKFRDSAGGITIPRERKEICGEDSSGMTWENAIRRAYGNSVRRVTRYAIKKEPGVWDPDRLRRAAAGLSPEYSLDLIDGELYRKCLENSWSRDLVAQYGSYERFREWGLGAVILKGEELVAGASSYSSYRGGIEVEIDTREDQRRRGLAYVCGARLILECCSRGLYPSWDAHNLWSVALAEKLGYHFDHSYAAYETEGG